MLKTNSKQARENIRNYIISIADLEAYNLPEAKDFNELAQKIYNIFIHEQYDTDNVKRWHNYNEYAAFTYWCSGLPSILDTADYYCKSAINVLGEILQETEQERNEFTEEQAEQKLDYLIYREIKNAIER